MQDDKSKMSERIAVVETRQEGLEEMVERVLTKMDSLIDSDMKNRRTPWGILLTAVGLTVTIVTMIGSAWIAPINVQLVSMEKRIESVDQLSKETRSIIENKKR